MFEQIGSGAKSAKDAFAGILPDPRDLGRSTASRRRRSPRKFVRRDGKGGGGFGRPDLGLFQWAGFASGLRHSGPGTTIGFHSGASVRREYVLRAEAVRRVGVDFLHA